jgi:hypothetical protein
LAPSIGVEAGFGVGLQLTERILVEGRFRVIQDTYSWRPLNPALPNSSLTDLSVLVDGGVGWRF